MKGDWSWSEQDRSSILQKLRTSSRITILRALKAKDDVGLSNAEIDSLLETSSQWLVFWELRELMALGVAKYEVQFFGEPGKYKLTESGLSILKELESADQK